MADEDHPDLSVLSSAIGYHLRRAQLAVFQDFTACFAELDLRPAEFSVLTVISRNPGLKQGEVAALLDIQRANFVALMDRLERRGLAERRRSPTDRRSYGLWLTRSGAQVTQRMFDLWHAHEDRWVERLGGAGERDRLLDLLNRISTPE
ncbi:MarR family winged helix-turn-helix transcriptional regulator [Oceanicella sp. SM1341]|uniref:MarR family winged helix-turn-helix transcriptional regulator n=1 Tax=Oceanicella sp. SM1341 TaxID=1548889 RepID=UPI000E4ED5B2|nr:MarR family winged helix-turn-helix transcriptional regulator [Oceanicella sp. SM1341]